MGANIKIKKFDECGNEKEHSRLMRLILDSSEVKSQCLSHVDHAFYFARGYCPIHTHENSEEIFLITRGTGIFYLDGKEYPYKPGDIFCVPKQVKHGLDCSADNDTEHIVCCVYV